MTPRPRLWLWLALAALSAGLRAPPGLRPPRAAVLRMAADQGPTEPPAENVPPAPEAEAPPGGAPARSSTWTRISKRVREADSLELDELPTVLDGVAQDVDAAISSRRRRLQTKLAKSLKSFRAEVQDEVELQADQERERRQRLKSRQSAIVESLSALREDILDYVEDSLKVPAESTKSIEKALGAMRSTWEDEVNDLVSEARSDVDLAVSDLEEVITQQREKFDSDRSAFEKVWLEQGVEVALLGMPPRGKDNGTAAATNASVGPNLALIKGVLPRGIREEKLAELQGNLSLVSAEVESDLKTFKKRWQVTTDKIDKLPANIPKLKSLAAARMYVADTIFAGDVPALLTERSGKYVGVGRRLLDGKDVGPAIGVRPPASRPSGDDDPFGLREDVDDEVNPVLRPTAASDLRQPGRHINIVTTAALPWMTGTSINPLLRAAYLSKAGYNVTLVVPWLVPSCQAIIFPSGLSFEKPKEQEQYIKWWLENKASVSAPGLRLRWYPAKYSQNLLSIIQDVDDITTVVPAHERDAVILEEPEHLNWYHHGERWTDMYNHVVGIAHTNYVEYATYDTNENIKFGDKAKWTDIMNKLVCSAHTDVVVRLSATLSPLIEGEENDLVCNVHGVRAEFLAIGAATKERQAGAYFLGKALLAKGYRELIEALDGHAKRNGRDDIPPIDTYGSGGEYEIIVEGIEKAQLPITPHAGIDHAHPAMHGYRVFVNPSTSDVLCTATAEALAMGKKVVIPDHPSNAFFKQFSNAYLYQDPSELVPMLNEALASEPQPMPAMEQYQLSWEAASERLLDAAAQPAGTPRAADSLSNTRNYYVHWVMGTQPLFDVFREATGVGPVIPWERRKRLLQVRAKLAARSSKRLAKRLQQAQEEADAPSGAQGAAAASGGSSLATRLVAAAREATREFEFEEAQKAAKAAEAAAKTESEKSEAEEEAKETAA